MILQALWAVSEAGDSAHSAIACPTTRLGIEVVVMRAEGEPVGSDLSVCPSAMAPSAPAGRDDSAGRQERSITAITSGPPQPRLRAWLTPPVSSAALDAATGSSGSRQWRIGAFGMSAGIRLFAADDDMTGG